MLETSAGWLSGNAQSLSGSETDRIVKLGMHRWFLMPLIAEIEPAFELVRARKRDLASMV